MQTVHTVHGFLTQVFRVKSQDGSSIFFQFTNYEEPIKSEIIKIQKIKYLYYYSIDNYFYL